MNVDASLHTPVEARVSSVKICLFKSKSVHLVYDLKSVGALEIKFVAPIPEQIATTTMHFLKVPGELC